MVSEAFKDYILFCFIAILILIGPVYKFFQTTENSCNINIQSSIDTFQENVRKDGYIDLKSYNKFLNDVSKSGKLYKVELIHTKKFVFPYKANDFQICKIDYGTQQIINKIKNGSDKYTMAYGDNFKVIATEKTSASSWMLLAQISGRYDLNKPLSFNGGGMVKNEVYN